MHEFVEEEIHKRKGILSKLKGRWLSVLARFE